jgi:hypothetical protein
MGLRLVSPVGAFPLCREMELTDPRYSVVYARKLDVINRGLSGYNTDWAIPVFEQVSLADLFDQGVANSELSYHRL